jgi:KUP system potassium uptake protein
MLLVLRSAEETLRLDQLLDSLTHHPPARIRGTGVYLTAHQTGVPRVLLHHLKNEQFLHDSVVLLSVEYAHVPVVADDERITVDVRAHGFMLVVARFGFLESPAIATVLDHPRFAPFRARLSGRITYYLAHEHVLAGAGRTSADLPMWRKRLFVFLTRNAHPATDFFGIPPNATVELGVQLEL